MSDTKGFVYNLPEGVKGKKVSVVEVGPFNESGLAAELNKFFDINIKELVRADAYVLVHPEQLSLENLCHGKPFVDPIVHRAALNSPLISQLGSEFDFALQSMLNPGMSDAEGNVALKEALLALDTRPSATDHGFYAKHYFVKANGITQEQLKWVSDFLANPDKCTKIILNKEAYVAGKDIEVPLVELKPAPMQRYDVVKMSNDELLKMNSERKLAATLEELLVFKEMYKDSALIEKRRKFGMLEPEKATDVEVETWFGLRSEHCFHKEFNAVITIDDLVDDGIFRKAYNNGWIQKQNGKYVVEKGIFTSFVKEPLDLIERRLEARGRNWIVSALKDNAGAVYYNDKYMFCIKVETHNSPSQKEPVQGAKTGLNGVIRDVMAMMLGTFYPIANFFYYGTGHPAYKGWLPKGVKHPYVIIKGITQGVREAGNEMQIAVVNGGAVVDPRFMGKGLVHCGTVGWSLVKSKDGRSYIDRNPQVGDFVYIIGQAVGHDGLHGATESSLSMGGHISLGHVQTDFSFIQAKTKELIIEAARNMLFSKVNDFGAMGLGSASEISKFTNGIEVDLSLHPRKYQGLMEWHVSCSETQDRMYASADPGHDSEIMGLGKLHDIEVTRLGTLTDSGFMHFKSKGETVALLELERLFNQEPRKKMHAVWRVVENKPLKVQSTYSLEESLGMVMSQPDVASKEWFFRQKDSSVQGATIQGPLIGLKQEVDADATIQKPLDTEGEDFGAIAYAMASSPKLSDIDAYLSSQRSFVDMVGKIIAVGGALPDMDNPKWDAWAVCGNYCQPNSESRTTMNKEDGEHNLAALVREAIGVREAIERLNIPVISGKDSMKCSGIYDVPESFTLDQVPPDLRRHLKLGKHPDKGTPAVELHNPDSYLATCAVKIQDYRKCVNQAFKQKNDLIYIIGTTKNHLGASQYAQAAGYKEQDAPLEGGAPPQVNFFEFGRAAKALNAVIDKELVASCSYLHNGGLASSVVKASFAGELGAEIDMKEICRQGDFTDDALLYSETPGRFIVTIDPKDRTEFEKLMKDTVSYALIGRVTAKDMRVFKLDGSRESASLERVKTSYQQPFRFGLDMVAHG